MLSHCIEGAHHLPKAKNLSVFPQYPTCSGAACLKALVPAATSSAVAASALKEQSSQATALQECQAPATVPKSTGRQLILFSRKTSEAPHLQLGIVSHSVF